MSEVSEISADDDQTDYVPPKNGGKKKLKNIQLWKKNVRKVMRSLGEEYTSARGKRVPRKFFNILTSVREEDFILRPVEKPIKDVKIKDVLSLTPYMKPENAEWLKQILTFQGQDQEEPLPGPSRRPVRHADDESDDSVGSSEFGEY